MRSKHAPNVELARANFESGIQYAPHMYENYFNAGMHVFGLTTLGLKSHLIP